MRREPDAYNVPRGTSDAPPPAMPNNQTGNGRTASGDRARHWTDERDTDQYGQGQSGYGAGRHGEDRALRDTMENRNASYPSQRDEARHQNNNGVDDRWTGRGGQSWSPEYTNTPGSQYPGGPRDVGYGQQGQIGSQRMSYRGKGPQGFTRSDDRIREHVCEALTDDHHVDASHIEVVVKNGEVILTGTVSDRRQKRAAEECAEHLPGVKDVQNSLRVQDREQMRTSGGEPSMNEASSNTDTKRGA